MVMVHRICGDLRLQGCCSGRLVAVNYDSAKVDLVKADAGPFRLTSAMHGTLFVMTAVRYVIIGWSLACHRLMPHPRTWVHLCNLLCLSIWTVWRMHFISLLLWMLVYNTSLNNHQIRAPTLMQIVGSCSPGPLSWYLLGWWFFSRRLSLLERNFDDILGAE